MRKKIYFSIWMITMCLQAWMYRKLMRLYSKEINQQFIWLKEKGK
jgi:hypothetical protein